MVISLKKLLYSTYHKDIIETIIIKNPVIYICKFFLSTGKFCSNLLKKGSSKKYLIHSLTFRSELKNIPNIEFCIGKKVVAKLLSVHMTSKK